MLNKLVSDKYIDKTLDKIFNHRSYLGIILYMWLVLFLVLFLLIIIEPLGRIVEKLLGIEMLIPSIFIFCLIITIVLCFISPFNTIYRQKNILEELHSYNEYITRYKFLTDSQIDQIHKNSHFFTKDFQKYLLENTLSDHDPKLLKKIICLEIKNHVLKDGLIWQFLRVITSMFGYIGISISWLSFIFILDSELSRDTVVTLSIMFAVIMIISYVLFFCHMCICGYFTRKKIKATKFLGKKLPSPWEYNEKISVRND